MAKASFRRSSIALAALMLALANSGCTPGDPTALTASTVPLPPPPTDQARLRTYAEDLAPRYAAHPEDKVVAIRYARALRGLGQHAQAVAVLQQLAVKNPHDMTVLSAYGKALADAGRLQEAADVLEHSHTPDRPNWTVLSAQGSVADQMGDHDRAQAYYAAALKIVPDEPEILSNLGLSYALQRRMPLAESTLRQAAAQPNADTRVRQNLALVLTLEGKYEDAEAVSRRDLAPIDAAENVQTLKRTIAQSDTWSARPADSEHTHSRKVAKSRPRDDEARRETPTRTAAADDVNR